MLVLHRREGDDILVSGPARIRVMEIKSGRIKIGIEADRSTRIDRGEIDALRPPSERIKVSTDSA
jgi:carbon storage regulator CsrA